MMFLSSSLPLSLYTILLLLHSHTTRLSVEGFLLSTGKNNNNNIICRRHRVDNNYRRQPSIVLPASIVTDSIIQDQEKKSAIIQITDKSFQLEENEDRNNCITELVFCNDNTITVGITDGPILSKGTGSWSFDGNTFVMNIIRTYAAGQSNTDMGQFTFDVERSYVGEVSYVGENLGFSGVIHSTDDIFGDREVGFFSMMDTSNVDDSFTPITEKGIVSNGW